jgi:predicted  nucleic acid-binding Zn-ribbon protein
MNGDIKTMLELQLYWDKILTSRAVIEKTGEKIRIIEKDLADVKNRLASMGKNIKELKSTIRQEELTLSEMGSRIKKLEERKRIIQTEKELRALEKEIDVIKFDTGNTEEKTLSTIDELDKKEKEYAVLEQSVNDRERRLEDEKPKTAVETARHEEIIKFNLDKFNSLIGTLPSLYKSKFLKMINSRDGKGIARVEGEICGSCNFKIPAFLAIEASKEDKVVNCTNCGKYIYKETLKKL